MVWFVYASLFAGIPYQDPTPEIAANYAFHSKISNSIIILGLGSLLIGLISAILKYLVAKIGNTENKGINSWACNMDLHASDREVVKWAGFLSTL